MICLVIEHLDDYRPELILSGHTHGGQIWPLNYLVKLRVAISQRIAYFGIRWENIYQQWHRLLGSQAEIAYII